MPISRLVKLGVLNRAFSPASISGLALDLDAATISGTDGDVVSTFPDGSGAGLHFTQATTAAKPTLKLGIVNGWPVARFDGVDDLMTNAGSLNFKDDSTVFLVANVASATVNQGLLSKSTGDIAWLAWNATATGYHMAEAGVAVMAQKGADSITGAFAVFGFTYDGTTATLYENGASVGSGAYARGLLANNATTYLGYEGSSGPLNGDVARVVVYNRLLSSAERSRMERFLGGRYGIAVA